MKNAFKTMGFVAIYVFAFVLAFALGVASKFLFSGGFGVNRLHVDWNESVGTVVNDLAYGDGELNKFDLYLPADKTHDGYGLVVYLHGGGFTSGDKRQDASWLRYFTSKGLVAAGINYSLRTKNNSVSISDMTNEIKASMPVVVAEAEKRGYPIKKIAVSGSSAGACLALIYAYRDGRDAPAPIACVMETVGPTTFEPEVWMKRPLASDDDFQKGAAWVQLMTGFEVTEEAMRNGEYKRYIDKISPVALVDESSPPTLCAYGIRDKIVPFASAKLLTDALDQYGIEYDYFEFLHSGHALLNDPEQAEQYLDKLDEYLERHMSIKPKDDNSRDTQQETKSEPSGEHLEQ